MKSYKKIIPVALALGMFTFGGMSCTKDTQKEPAPLEELIQTPKDGNKKLRAQVFKYLDGSIYTYMHGSSYSMIKDGCEIKVTACYNQTYGIDIPALDLIITNKTTNDTIRLSDYNFDGDIDSVTRNYLWEAIMPLENQKEMEYKFDELLESIKPKLEQEIKHIKQDIKRYQ